MQTGPLAQEPGFDLVIQTNTLRKQNEKLLEEYIEAITKTIIRDEWIVLLQHYKIPGGRVNKIAEAFEQPQVAARNLVGELTHLTYGRVKFVKNPLQHSGLNISYNEAQLLLGEHTKQLLKLHKN